MTYFSKRIKEHLKAIGMTKYQVFNVCKVGESDTYDFINGKRRPTDNYLMALADCKELGLSLTQLRAWRCRDDYSLEEIKLALE